MTERLPWPRDPRAPYNVNFTKGTIRKPYKGGLYFGPGQRNPCAICGGPVYETGHFCENWEEKLAMKPSATDPTIGNPLRPPEVHIDGDDRDHWLDVHAHADGKALTLKVFSWGEQCGHASFEVETLRPLRDFLNRVLP